MPTYDAMDTATLRAAARDTGVAVHGDRSFPRQYRVQSTVYAKTYLSAANSDADAEIRAFNKLILKAHAEGGTSLIQIRREILRDGTLPGRSRRSADGGIAGRGDRVDEFMVAKYLRGVGTLSIKPDSPLQGDPADDIVSVQFSGKAVIFTE